MTTNGNQWRWHRKAFGLFEKTKNRLKPGCFKLQKWMTNKKARNTNETVFGQEPITQSLHANCTLESTLSCIFLFLELRYVGVLQFPAKTCWRSHNTLKKLTVKDKRWPLFSLSSRGPQLSYDWLLCKHLQKNPMRGASMNKKIRDRVDSG